jgi:putative phage-type endonuclease
MSAILKLVQGSAEWHAHRAQFRNTSESAAVMGLSPFQTPYKLWMVRTGRTTVPATAPMQHGSQMEPRARAAYEKKTGLVMQPLVLTDGAYSASLDGITLEGDLIVEIIGGLEMWITNGFRRSKELIWIYIGEKAKKRCALASAND